MCGACVGYVCVDRVCGEIRSFGVCEAVECSAKNIFICPLIIITNTAVSCVCMGSCSFIVIKSCISQRIMIHVIEIHIN
jgi:hypothetical protein